MTVEGIEHITPDDIGFAREFGFRIKLLGVARRIGDGIDQSVQPAWCGRGTPLADVDGAFNARAGGCGRGGPFFFAGRGAGEAPTASAVIADLVDIARGILGPAFGQPGRAALKPLKPADAGRCVVGLVSALRGAGCARRAGRDRRPSGGIAAFPSKA